MASVAEKLINKLPKAELHIHIEGTLEPEMMLRLAKINRIELPYKTIEAVKKAYQFTCLQDFLDVYYLGMSVLIHKQDFYDLTYAYLQRVHQDGLTHVELFFDPQAHTDRGIKFETVLEGITLALKDGEKELDISSKLIMCFLRHLSEEQAFETLECACQHKDHIYAVGLDSSEEGNPPEKFERVFAAAREEGFAAVAHVGEEGEATNVETGLDLLKIERIDHGNKAFNDPKLIKRLEAEQVPLTMCPLSNLRLKGIPDLQSSPIKRALDANLLVCVNSDDPSYFGGYLNDNYRAVHKALDLSEDELITLAQNSFKSSFLTDREKQKRLDDIENCVEAIRKQR